MNKLTGNEKALTSCFRGRQTADHGNPYPRYHQAPTTTHSSLSTFFSCLPNHAPLVYLRPQIPDMGIIYAS